MTDFREYDIYVKIDQEKIHIVTYLLESQAHLMSVRNRQENGLLKIIVPGPLKDEAIKLINSMTEQVKLEVVKVEPHNGVV
jgi:hypothetical protein